MKEIFYYENNDYNLCSIKRLEPFYSDKRYLIGLISKILKLTGHLLITAQRPYYDVDSLMKRLRLLSHKLYELKVSSDFFSLSFSHSSADVDDDVLILISDIWFQYEQPMFCFSLDSNVSFSRRGSWDEITKQWRSYVFFKGTQEDVLWIGKSSELEFSSIIGKSVE